MSLIFGRTFTCVIPGDPTAWKRAGKAKNGHIYDSQKYLKESWAMQMRFVFKQQEFLQGPLHQSVTFFMPIPRSYSKKKQALLKGPMCLEKFHQSPPDESNLIKLIEDAAQGVIFKNDCAISTTYAIKIYDEKPRTQITYQEIVGWRNQQP